MSYIVSVFNQKGGVGKTTSVINLSSALGKLGGKILIVDGDPQGNTTSGLGIEKKSLDISIYDMLINQVKPDDIIIETSAENVFIIPANVDLAGAEIELTNAENRETILRQALLRLDSKFDYIFIDCPPSLGLLSINALVASKSVIIPIQCEYYALEGVSQLVDTISLVKRSLNPNLEIEGVILSMFDGRTNLSIQVVDEVKKYFKGKVYTSIIPRNVRLAEAPSYGLSVIDYDSKSKGAEAYMDLGKEFLELSREEL
ncbi:MAG TPA: AAA family ATPase [Tissierellales bacterium]|nr:AAA family ATPase [Tissierellales bacterium]